MGCCAAKETKSSVNADANMQLVENGKEGDNNKLTVATNTNVHGPKDTAHDHEPSVLKEGNSVSVSQAGGKKKVVKKKGDFDPAQFKHDVLDELNSVRNAPAAYAQKITSHIAHIKPNDKGKMCYEHGGAKITLANGEEGVKAFAETLLKTSPLGHFTLIEDGKAELPDDIEDQKAVITGVNAARDALRKAHPERKIECFFHAGHPDAEAVTVFQLVDDSKVAKRNAILDSKFNKVGISLKKAPKGKNYYMYLTFTD